MVVCSSLLWINCKKKWFMTQEASFKCTVFKHLRKRLVEARVWWNFSVQTTESPTSLQRPLKCSLTVVHYPTASNKQLYIQPILCCKLNFLHFFFISCGLFLMCSFSAYVLLCILVFFWLIAKLLVFTFNVYFITALHWMSLGGCNRA